MQKIFKIKTLEKFLVQNDKYYDIIKNMKNITKKYIQCVHNANKEATPQETIYAIKSAGFDGVFLQWFNKDWEFSQQEQLELCRKLGLEIPFVHLGYKGINDIWRDGDEGDILVKNYFHDLDICKSNDIDMVVMHLTSKTDAPSPSQTGIKRFQQIVDYAENLGIKIAFENTKIFGYLEYVFENIKNKNIGICFDSGHCHCHFEDEFNWEMFKDKIFAVHLHDNDKSKDQHLLPFDGIFDFHKFGEYIRKYKFEGTLMLEALPKNSDFYNDFTAEEFYAEAYERVKRLRRIVDGK